MPPIFAGWRELPTSGSCSVCLPLLVCFLIQQISSVPPGFFGGGGSSNTSRAKTDFMRSCGEQRTWERGRRKSARGALLKKRESWGASLRQDSLLPHLRLPPLRELGSRPEGTGMLPAPPLALTATDAYSCTGGGRPRSASFMGWPQILKGKVLNPPAFQVCTRHREASPIKVAHTPHLSPPNSTWQK